MNLLRAALLLLLSGLPAWAQAPLKIAVLAYRPKAQVMEQWLPMAKHLETVLGQPVQVTAYDYQEMNAAIARNEMDVVLTNPGHYILLKQRNVMSAPLVTQVSREGEQRLAAFGGVIFTRADDSRIASLKDLAGKRIAAVGTASLGGYQMQAFEMLEAGVPPPLKDRLVSVGMPHDGIVAAVLSGQTDAGFVRTGVLESLAREGKLDLSRIRVINKQDLSSFPYAVSTRLHPEWPVAVLPQVDVQLAHQLAIALLSVRPESPAAQAIGIYGFTTPADYSGVEQLLRRLRMPPFDRAPEFTVADLWDRYAPWIAVFGIMFLVLVGLSIRLVLQNRHIQQSEAKSSTILNNLDAFIYVKDRQGRYLFANERVLGLWGKSLEEVTGFGDELFFDAETVARIRDQDHKVLVEGKTVKVEETYTVRETGHTGTYLSTKLPLRRPDGSIYALCGISTDITDRKQSEEARAYLAAIVESSDDAIASKSLEGTITSWNQAAVRMFGYSVEEALGQSISILLPDDRKDEELEILKGIMAGESIKNLETVLLTKDGRSLAVSVTISPIRSADGTIIGASKVIRDITERKQAEQALRDALAFSEQIISSAQEGISVYDLEGRWIRINPYLEALMGLSSTDLAGKLPTEVFPQSAGDKILEGIQRALKGEHVTNPLFPWAFPASGRSGWGTSIQSPLLGARGEIIGAIGISTDITEIRRAEELQRKLEADLQQTQKLESLGSLAGGVAHDMNNVLAAIQAIAQTLKLTYALDGNLVESLKTIEKASTRGRDLVKGLTNFARKELREAEVLDLNALVREEMDILRRTTLQKVDLVLDLDSSQPFVQGERGTLASALMNLCVNAVDAMPGGGTLTLRTGRPSGSQVELSVEDSGEGMSPEVLSRAMEPFFTTKPIGKGTGLGLAMVYTTAKTHGGTVRMTSEPGKGTCVTLRLPTVARAAAPRDGARPEVSVSRPLEILQVDDDELILIAVPGMIEVLGHHVTTATGGREALALLAGGLEPDLVILDLNMPGMNGEETLKELRKTHPNLPVLLATGFLDTTTEAILRQDRRVRILTKPFSMSELDAKFHEIGSLRN